MSRLHIFLAQNVGFALVLVVFVGVEFAIVINGDADVVGFLASDEAAWVALIP